MTNTEECTHKDQIKDVHPKDVTVCEDCIKTGDEWVSLRMCLTCGHVGCCDQSPHRHATAHYHHTSHPIMEGYDPPEGWRYGFPRPYQPKEGETLADTLRRDGYPEKLIAEGMADHCRFIGR